MSFFGFGTASIVEEGDQGYQYPSYDTIPPPPAPDYGPPPTPQAEPGSYLVNPYYPAPPSYPAPPATSDIGAGVASFFRNIFGQPVTPQGQVLPPPRPAPSTPVWVVPVVVGVAAIGLLVVLKGRRGAVAGYGRSRRRRNHR